MGYKVLQAENGKKATQIFRDNVDDICLVILDEKLPDELGSDTCKRLKGFEPHVKVLHTSGLGRTQGDNSLECGCEAFLLKPYRIEELSNKIKGFVRKYYRDKTCQNNIQNALFTIIIIVNSLITQRFVPS